MSDVPICGLLRHFVRVLFHSDQGANARADDFTDAGSDEQLRRLRRIGGGCDRVRVRGAERCGELCYPLVSDLHICGLLRRFMRVLLDSV